MPGMTSSVDVGYLDPPFNAKNPLPKDFEAVIREGLKSLNREHFDIHETPEKALIAVPRYSNPTEGNRAFATVTVNVYYAQVNLRVYELLENGYELGDLLLEGTNWERRWIRREVQG